MARTAKTNTTEDPATAPVEGQQETATGPEAASRSPRPGSKLAKVLSLLEAPDGATIAEVMAATGWQSHTVRGALAGSIARKLGRIVTSEKVEGRGRVYRIGTKGA